MIKEKNLVFLLSSSAVLTAAWIGFTLYHTAVTSTLDETLTVQIQPISPRFDEATIADLLSRPEIPPTYELRGIESETEQEDAVSSLSPTPESTPSPTPPAQDVLEEEPILSEEEPTI